MDINRHLLSPVWEVTHQKGRTKTHSSPSKCKTAAPVEGAADACTFSSRADENKGEREHDEKPLSPMIGGEGCGGLAGGSPA